MGYWISLNQDVVCSDVSSANFFVGSSLSTKCWHSNEVVCDLEEMRSNVTEMN